METISTLMNLDNGTLDGITPKLLVSSLEGARAGIMIHNAGRTYELWITAVKDKATAPTLNLNTKLFCVPPSGTLIVPFGNGLDIYALNSSGSALTTAYVAMEYGS